MADPHAAGPPTREPAADADLAVVGTQLGRTPRGTRAVAHRCPCGLPDVVETTPRLADERSRLAAEIDGSASAELREEHRRSLRSVEEQLAVADRLTSARDTLLARLQSTALGLEGLVARTTEVLALSASAGAGLADDGIAGLAAELDGLRAGLAETEELSRQVLDRR